MMVIMQMDGGAKAVNWMHCNGGMLCRWYALVEMQTMYEMQMEGGCSASKSSLKLGFQAVVKGGM